MIVNKSRLVRHPGLRVGQQVTTRSTHISSMGVDNLPNRVPAGYSLNVLERTHVPATSVDSLQERLDDIEQRAALHLLVELDEDTGGEVPYRASRLRQLLGGFDLVGGNEDTENEGVEGLDSDCNVIVFERVEIGVSRAQEREKRDFGPLAGEAAGVDDEGVVVRHHGEDTGKDSDEEGGS